MQNKKLPADVIKHWPEIFGDIDIKVVPVEYLESIYISFKNGKTWSINFDTSVEKEALEMQINDYLEEIFDTYGDEVVSVDFKIDTRQVKKDVQERTKYFLKKRK